MQTWIRRIDKLSMSPPPQHLQCSLWLVHWNHMPCIMNLCQTWQVKVWSPKYERSPSSKNSLRMWVKINQHKHGKYLEETQRSMGFQNARFSTIQQKWHLGWRAKLLTTRPFHVMHPSWISYSNKHVKKLKDEEHQSFSNSINSGTFHGSKKAKFWGNHADFSCSGINTLNNTSNSSRILYQKNLVSGGFKNLFATYTDV